MLLPLGGSKYHKTIQLLNVGKKYKNVYERFQGLYLGHSIFFVTYYSAQESLFLQGIPKGEALYC